MSGRRVPVSKGGDAHVGAVAASPRSSSDASRRQAGSGGGGGAGGRGAAADPTSALVGEEAARAEPEAGPGAAAAAVTQGPAGTPGGAAPAADAKAAGETDNESGGGGDDDGGEEEEDGEGDAEPEPRAGGATKSPRPAPPEEGGPGAPCEAAAAAEDTAAGGALRGVMARLLRRAPPPHDPDEIADGAAVAPDERPPDGYWHANERVRARGTFKPDSRRLNAVAGVADIVEFPPRGVAPAAIAALAERKRLHLPHIAGLDDSGVGVYLRLWRLAVPNPRGHALAVYLVGTPPSALKRRRLPLEDFEKDTAAEFVFLPGRMDGLLSGEVAPGSTLLVRLDVPDAAMYEGVALVKVRVRQTAWVWPPCCICTRGSP
jgi:hypothetical protein